jgi:hypothetical protein
LKSINYVVHEYVIFSIFLFISLSEVEIFASALSSEVPSVYGKVALTVD